jgi:Uma2 family endonuclease
MSATMETVGLVNERLHLLNVEEYERLGHTGIFDQKRVELIHGRVVDKMVMGEAHAWLVQRMTRLLVETLGAVADIRPQLPVRASDDSMPEPDFLVVPRRDTPGPRVRKGYLVIEIADSSLTFDRAVKAPLYAATPTPEYWIVDARKHQLEVFRKPVKGAYTWHQVLGPADVIRPVAFPRLELSLASFLRPLKRRRQ